MMVSGSRSRGIGHGSGVSGAIAPERGHFLPRFVLNTILHVAVCVQGCILVLYAVYPLDATFSNAGLTRFARGANFFPIGS